tara:strand:- start:641 stop:1057 length:417 start_codon:yes stop_codon:yes gene_type:complete
MGRFLAIDHGEKRVGLAISDPNKIISKPLKTLILSDLQYFYQELLKIISDYDIEKLVIGLPVSMDGKKTQQTTKVEEFKTYLQNKIDIPIVMFDERLSSISAKKSLISQGVKTGYNKSQIDQTAAAIFLQQYIDTLNY